jgi:hypothetical protein
MNMNNRNPMKQNLLQGIRAGLSIVAALVARA